jgi:hypothetical protein
MARQTDDIKTPAEHARLDQLFEDIRAAGFDIDNDDNPQFTDSNVLLITTDDENDRDSYSDKFALIIAKNGKLFTFHAHLASCDSMLSEAAANDVVTFLDFHKAMVATAEARQHIADQQRRAAMN